MRRSFRGWGRALRTGAVIALALAVIETGPAAANPTRPAGAEMLSIATIGNAQSVDRQHRPPPAATPELHWTDCEDGLQCATARVPLDYDRPSGSMISLALV